MKIITSILTLIGINFIGLSQATIPNQNIEEWEQVVVKDSVRHWKTSTQLLQSYGSDIKNAYLIEDAQNGNNAIHLETIMLSTDTLIGYVSQQNSDYDLIGFPYSDMVTNLKGWYKCNNILNDKGIALIILKNNGVVYSETIHSFTGNVSTWTEFDIPLTNGNTLTPDSVFISFMSSNFQNDYNQKSGNWLEIDNIWLENNNVTTTPILGFSFEDLIQDTIEQPVGFWSFDPKLYNFGDEKCLTKSSDAAQGNSSMRIEKTQLSINTGYLPFVSNGFYSFQNGLNGGYPFNAQPDIYSLQYKYVPTSSDDAYASLHLFKNGITLNTDSMIQLPPTSTWTTKALAININQAPDSVRVTFFPGENVGSYLLIDNLQFLGGDVSIDEVSTYNEWIMYPNPSNSILNIKSSKNTFIKVVDLTGKTIYSEQSSSSNIIISTDTWVNGIYFVTTNHNDKTETKKLIIKH
jgi:hypothetical protein